MRLQKHPLYIIRRNGVLKFERERVVWDMGVPAYFSNICFKAWKYAAASSEAEISSSAAQQSEQGMEER